jgi:hypothetical protein
MATKQQKKKTAGQAEDFNKDLLSKLGGGSKADAAGETAPRKAAVADPEGVPGHKQSAKGHMRTTTMTLPPQDIRTLQELRMDALRKIGGLNNMPSTSAIVRVLIAKAERERDDPAFFEGEEWDELKRGV